MLKIGDRIQDNDPRVGTRVLVVENLDDRYAYCLPAFGTTKKTTYRILRNRIFADGKTRRSGFSVIRDQKP